MRFKFIIYVNILYVVSFRMVFMYLVSEVFFLDNRLIFIMLIFVFKYFMVVLMLFLVVIIRVFFLFDLGLKVFNICF